MINNMLENVKAPAALNEMYFLIRRGGGSVCCYNQTIPPSQSQILLLTTDPKFHNLQQMKCTSPRENSNSKSYHYPHD